MNAEKERLRDTIIYEAFDRFESDREARERLARERCNEDYELLDAVLADLGAEEEIRERSFLLDLAGSAPNGLIPKGTEIGEYTIEALLGRGGMGAVYEAQQRRLQRVVAIKFLQTRLARSATERFLSEARALSAVQSEHVVHVYTYDDYQGQPYIVMEYVRGVNLADGIREGRCGDLRNRLAIARQIAEALEDIHQAGIAHRDVKPSNVLMQASGKIKLLDFGIAWRQDSQLTQAGQVMGTPAYMAPEQILRQVSGSQLHESDRYKRVDVYSFGILLYELLTGRLPFLGDAQGEIEHNILHQALPLEPLHEAGVPPDVIKLIQQTTAKNPGQRPGKCLDIAERLAASSDADEAERPASKYSGRRARITGLAAASIAATAIAALFLASRSTPPAVQTPASSVTSTAATTTGERRPRLTAATPVEPEKVSVSAAVQLPPPPASSKEAGSISSPAMHVPQTKTPDSPPLAAFPEVPLIQFGGSEAAAPVTHGVPAPVIATPAPRPDDTAELKHWATLRNSDDIAALQLFWEKYPDSRFVPEAKSIASRLDWNRIRNSNSPEVLLRFASRFADSSFAVQATNLAKQWEARAAASKDILRTLEQYADAYSSRDLTRVVSFRSLSPEHQKRIAATFSDSRMVRLTLKPRTPQFGESVTPDTTGPDYAPQTATVETALELALVANNGDAPAPVRQVTVFSLKRSGQGWTITNEMPPRRIGSGR